MIRSMRYREISPRPPLSSFVECFWTLEGDGPQPGAAPERILPDGCVELILNFGERFSQHNDNGRELQPRHFLVGQMSGPILISPNGAVELLGIRFHPGGTSAFMRVPMNALTDRIAELGSLSSELERELLSVSECLPALDEKIAAVEAALIGRLRCSSHESSAMRLAARIVQSAGVISVDQLASDAGISSRQLERRFMREIGVGPKLLSRILRAWIRLGRRSPSSAVTTIRPTSFATSTSLPARPRQFCWPSGARSRTPSHAKRERRIFPIPPFDFVVEWRRGE